MTGAVPGLPAGDDLDDEMWTAVRERSLVGREARRRAVKVVDGYTGFAAVGEEKMQSTP
jgi:hypothetical protein